MNHHYSLAGLFSDFFFLISLYSQSEKSLSLEFKGTRGVTLYHSFQKCTWESAVTLNIKQLFKKKKKSPNLYSDVLTHLFLLETNGELF